MPHFTSTFFRISKVYQQDLLYGGERDLLKSRWPHEHFVNSKNTLRIQVTLHRVWFIFWSGNETIIIAVSTQSSQPKEFLFWGTGFRCKLATMRTSELPGKETRLAFSWRRLHLLTTPQWKKKKRKKLILRETEKKSAFQNGVSLPSESENIHRAKTFVCTKMVETYLSLTLPAMFITHRKGRKLVLTSYGHRSFVNWLFNMWYYRQDVLNTCIKTHKHFNENVCKVSFI